jgi:hypothetical protein
VTLQLPTATPRTPNRVPLSETVLRAAPPDAIPKSIVAPDVAHAAPTAGVRPFRPPERVPVLKLSNASTVAELVGWTPRALPYPSKTGMNVR